MSEINTYEESNLDFPERWVLIKRDASAQYQSNKILGNSDYITYFKFRSQYERAINNHSKLADTFDQFAAFCAARILPSPKPKNFNLHEFMTKRRKLEEEIDKSLFEKEKEYYFNNILFNKPIPNFELANPKISA